MPAAARRLFLKPGAVFRNRVDDDDDTFAAIELVTVDPVRRIVSADISSYQNGALQFREALQGGYRQEGLQSLLCLRDVTTNSVEFRVFIKLSKKNPNRDRVVIRTEWGLKATLRALGKPLTSPGGSVEDPDCETFERGVQGSVNTPRPVSRPFPAAPPKRIDRPTTGDLSGSALVSGTVVVKGTVGTANAFLYDFDGRLFYYDGAASPPAYVDHGSVEYGTITAAGIPWSVFVQPPMGSTFVANDLDVMAVVP
jgi:hypothetical protein